MRASLLARAMASLFLCNRSDAVLSHAPKLNRGQLCGRIRRTFAAWINSVRRYLLPRLEMRPEDRTPAGAVLSRHQAEPGAEVAPAVKSLASADGGDKAGRDQRPDARHAHQPLTFGLGLAEFFDLAGDGLDALVQMAPVFVKTKDQLGHARRYLVLAVLQYREKRVAQGARAGPDGDALLDQEGADLVDRRRPAGDQSGPDAMTGLQIELILALLLDEAQVRAQRRLGDGLGIVVVVLLSLHERLDIDRRDDPRLVAQGAQGPADKVRAQARLHADDARRQLLERICESQPLDLPAEGNLAVGAEPDEVKNLLADIDADDRQWRCVVSVFGFMAASPVDRR